MTSFYSKVYQKIQEGKRLTPSDAISLFEMDVPSLGVLANSLKEKK